jgi:hypothetical protein
MKETTKSDPSKSIAIAVLHDARTELRNAADGGLELAEKLTGGLFRFVRKLNQRIDERSGDVLDGVERTLVNSRKAREARKAAKREARTEAKQSKRVDKAA